MKYFFLRPAFIILPILFASQQVLAAYKEKSPWSGQVEAMYSGSKGNTNEKDLAIESNIIYSGEKWKHSLNGELSIYENSGTRFSEELEFSHTAAYFLNAKNYLFNHASYEKDAEENIDKRLIEAVGYGHVFIKSDHHNLTSEVGVGKRKTVYLLDNDDELETVGYLGVFYDKELTKKISIEEEISIIGGSDNRVSKSTTALQLAITDSLSVGLRYKLEYTSNPPVENKKKDSTIDVSFRYSF